MDLVDSWYPMTALRSGVASLVENIAPVVSALQDEITGNLAAVKWLSRWLEVTEAFRRLIHEAISGEG